VPQRGFSLLASSCGWRVIDTCWMAAWAAIAWSNAAESWVAASVVVVVLPVEPVDATVALVVTPWWC